MNAWTPQMRLYQDWLRDQRGLVFDDYEALWRWSSTDLEAFWMSIWDYHGMTSPTPFKRVLDGMQMPGAVWFEGAQTNYAREVFRHAAAADAAGQPAIISENERGDVRELSWSELQAQVSAMAVTLRERGVGRGDRVAAYLPNIPEAVVAFLACASLGAIWSLCAPDMGAPAVLDRFRQIEPKVLVAVDGVHYAGRAMDRSQTVAAMRAELPSVETMVVLRTPYASGRLNEDLDFAAAAGLRGGDVDAFTPEWLPFGYPLWILYSSGTTGLPKALVHSHGGVLLNYLAANKHTDWGGSYESNTFGERFQWFTSTGWVMWNAQIAGLLRGTTICLYDGSPSGAKEAPDWTVLWRFAARHRVTWFGAGAAFYASCLKADVQLSACGDLSAVRALGSTGSPLTAQAAAWASDQFAGLGRSNIWWCNFSGGTDICGSFVTGNRELPPATGKMQCRHLGNAVEVWDEDGRPLIGRVGELVCVRPLPSMPIFLWGDQDGSRYLASYFDVYPGVWRHGDWLQVDADGTCTISGRSDATINRGGVRMGTSEVYAAVERLPDVLDALVVDLEKGQGDSELLMFVTLRAEAALDDQLRSQIASAIRTSLSPRFIPDRLIEAPGIPRTLSGKRQELPVKRILKGQTATKVINREAMANPEVLDWYMAFAATPHGKA